MTEKNWNPADTPSKEEIKVRLKKAQEKLYELHCALTVKMKTYPVHLLHMVI